MSYIPAITMRGLRSLVPGQRIYYPPRRNAVRVRVRRKGVWHDITHRVLRGTVTHTNDDPVALLDLTLLNGVGFPSLAPRVKTSPLNRDEDGEYAPLLDRYNEIMVEAAFSLDGSAPADFIPVFHGLLGDSIRTERDREAGVVVHLEARDLAKRLQDDMILQPVTYQNMYASQIIQALLDERFGPGAITLHVVGEDDFWVEEVTFEYVDTWQALQSFCEQSDKDIRYLFNEDVGAIVLTYWTPDLTMTPTWAVTERDIIRESLDVSDASLRHRVMVRYYDMDGYRQEVIAEDLSRRKNGEPIRTALIPESETSAIRDEQAAQRFANAVLTALKTEPAIERLVVPFNPYLRIYDVIRVENPGIRSEPDVYAIDELRLHFTADDWHTEIIASESVKIRLNPWLVKEAKQGLSAPARTRLMPPDQVTATTVIEDDALSIYVEWTPRTGVGLYYVRWRAVGDELFHTAQTEGLEYKITGLPGAAGALYPDPNLYPGSDVYPSPAMYEVGVYTVSPLGRSSAVNTVFVQV